jgi:hypothetical protein
MSWRNRFRRFGSRRRQEGEPQVARTPFVLIERRDLSPGGSALLAQLVHRYTVIPDLERQRYTFRVGVGDAEGDTDPADHLVAVLTELDPDWDEHFTWPRLLPGAQLRTAHPYK